MNRNQASDRCAPTGGFRRPELRRIVRIPRRLDVIAPQRATYRANLATWQKQVDARATFLMDQTAAQTNFDDAVNACETPGGTGNDPGSTAGPTPSPTSTATPAPTASPKPKALTESDKKRASAGCIMSVERPVILDQEPPAVGPEPVKPADPRPEEARG